MPGSAHSGSPWSRELQFICIKSFALENPEYMYDLNINDTSPSLAAQLANLHEQ